MEHAMFEKHREDEVGGGGDAGGRELWDGGWKQVALEWGLEREISVKNGNRRAERKEVGRKGRGEAGPKCHNAVSGTTN